MHALSSLFLVLPLLFGQAEGAQGGLERGRSAERGVSPGVELSELRTHLGSLLGNKEEPEPKAKGWFSEKTEGETSTPFTSSHPFLGNKGTSWL